MFKYLIMFLVLTFQTQMSFAETNSKVVIHINDTFKLGHLRNSIKNIRAEMGEKTDIKVVVNGKAVLLMLKSNQNSNTMVKEMLTHNVDIGLCHNSIRNNKVNPDLIIEGLRVLTKSGNATVIALQNQGYAYLKM